MAPKKYKGNDLGKFGPKLLSQTLGKNRAGRAITQDGAGRSAPNLVDIKAWSRRPEQDQPEGDRPRPRGATAKGATKRLSGKSSKSERRKTGRPVNNFGGRRAIGAKLGGHRPLVTRTQSQSLERRFQTAQGRQGRRRQEITPIELTWEMAVRAVSYGGPVLTNWEQGGITSPG